MVAGLFAQAGYATGDQLVPASSSNPLGFFEDIRINRLNDSLLAPHLPVGPGRPGRRHAWLAAPALSARPEADAEQHAQMAAWAGAAGPWCLKDPRWCFTLPAWQDVLPPSLRRVLVFRHPGAVVDSLLAMAARQPDYFAGLQVTPELGYRSWVAAYTHVLTWSLPVGRWLVVDDDALVSGGDLGPLCRFTGADLRPDGVRSDLRRSSVRADVPRTAERLHARLQRLARTT